MSTFDESKHERYPKGDRSSVKVSDEWKRLGFEKVKIRGVFYWQGVQIPVPGVGVVP